MDDSEAGPRWRLALSWADLDVFTRGSVPEALRPTAEALAPLQDRFHPALLRLRRGTEYAYAAVWSPDGPDLPPYRDLTLEDTRNVVLAQASSLICRVCAARFPALYPDTGLPFFGPHLAAHRPVSGCPACGSDFAASRIQALALLRPPGRPRVGNGGDGPVLPR
jgi:hypothetical protein